MVQKMLANRRAKTKSRFLALAAPETHSPPDLWVLSFFAAQKGQTQQAGADQRRGRGLGNRGGRANFRFGKEALGGAVDRAHGALQSNVDATRVRIVRENRVGHVRDSLRIQYEQEIRPAVAHHGLIEHQGRVVERFGEAAARRRRCRT